MIQNVNGSVPEFIKEMSKEDAIKQISKDTDDCLLITIIIDDTIDFVGDISYRGKDAIKKAISTEEYYEIEKNIYRMILPDGIYMYKKFGGSKKVVLVGSLVEKNENNRLDIMELHTKFLLKKSEAWG